MKKLKFSGRERAVLRAIDFTTGTSGPELMARTNLSEEDLVDILNGLLSVGYAEVVPAAESITAAALEKSLFEVNPSYALDIREALIRT